MTTIYRQKGRKHWYFKIRRADGSWVRRVGFTDKRATQELAAREQRAIDRGEVGLVDPFAETRGAQLAVLIADYGKALSARARAERYVDGVLERLKLVVATTGARLIADLDHAVVETFLGRLVRGELPPSRPRSKRGSPVPRKPASMVTRDRYVEALRSFGAWLHETDRWGSNPWHRLRKEARESDRRMEHRALSEAELQLLVDAAEVRCVQQWARGGESGGGHAGRDAAATAAEQVRRRGWMRGSLYLFAAFTGLRSNECALLRRRDLVLDGDEPHVVVRAANAKNRTEQRVPLLPLVVDRMRAHLKLQSETALQEGGRILDGAAQVFEVRRGLLEALRKDAEFAGIGLHDEEGRRLTFHGFRSSTATLLARAGVSMPIAMRVLRHSDANLTAKVYAKLGMGDMHRELREKMRPQVRPNTAEQRAVVGLSVPFASINAAAQKAAEQSMATAVGSLGSAPCLLVPVEPREGEWWALQESNRARGRLGGRSDSGPATTTAPAVTKGVTKDSGDPPRGGFAEGEPEAGEEPDSPGRLPAALGVLRRLRNDMGRSVFGADADLVDRLLRGAP